MPAQVPDRPHHAPMLVDGESHSAASAAESAAAAVVGMVAVTHSRAGSYKSC